MSICAAVEIVVNIHSFKNIDLYQMGLYYLKMQLFQVDQNGDINYALPYRVEETDHAKLINSFRKANINFEEQCVETKSLAVKPQDKKTILMGEIYHFRIEVDSYPIFDEGQIFLSCSLMHAGYDKFSQHQDNDDIFKEVKKIEFQISNLHIGLNDFVPMIFNTPHFCQVNGTIHSIIMDYRFKQISTENNQQHKTGKIIKNFHNFIHYLCPNSKKKEFDEFYNGYIQKLRNSYQKILKYTTQVRDNYLFKSDNYSLNDFSLPESIYILEGELQRFTQKESNDINQEYIPQIPRVDDGQVKEENKKQKKRIFDDIQKLDLEQIAELFLQEIHFMGQKNFDLWNYFINLIKQIDDRYIQKLIDDYHKQTKERQKSNERAQQIYDCFIKQLIIFDLTIVLHNSIQNKNNLYVNRWGESIFRNPYESLDLSENQDPKSGKQHKEIANQMRQKDYHMNFERFNVYDLNYFPNVQDHPILFEDIYVKKEIYQNYIISESKRIDLNRLLFESKKQDESLNQSQDIFQQQNNLFVFVHGFQGCSYDLRQFRTILTMIYPEIQVLISSSNELFTSGDIEIMGVNLAKEVQNHVQKKSGFSQTYISFIGFSMGGLIIRAALPHLSQYKNQMNTFMTLSSPHLGYMYNSSLTTDVGMWFLKNYNKIQSIQQLLMADSKIPEETLLYRLSQKEGLNWFKNIAFLSSYQDSFVPFESARVQKSPKTYHEQSKVNKYQQMAENLLGRVNADKIHRIDVNFNLSSYKLDNFIGRAAHILFIESKAIQYMLCYCFEYLFKVNI